MLGIFFGYKWYYKLKKVIKPSRAKTTWTYSKYRNLPHGVDEIGVKFYIFLWTLPRKGEVWMMACEQSELSLCRENEKCVIFQYSGLFVVTLQYSLSIWLSVICNIPNKELEIYNIESYSSILVFCCKTVIYVSSNVFAFILVSCWKFYRWQM